MTRTRKSYLLMFVTVAVALLLSTWGTGVSLAQEHDMDHGDHGEHDMDHGDPGTTVPGPTLPEPEPTVPEPTTPGPTVPGGDSEECSFLGELFGLCTPAGGGGQEEECSFLAELFGLCTPAGGGGQEEQCDFIEVILGDCNVGTDTCDSYGFLEWLSHHECHGHV